MEQPHGRAEALGWSGGRFRLDVWEGRERCELDVSTGIRVADSHSQWGCSDSAPAAQSWLHLRSSLAPKLGISVLLSVPSGAMKEHDV